MDINTFYRANTLKAIFEKSIDIDLGILRLASLIIVQPSLCLRRIQQMLLFLWYVSKSKIVRKKYKMVKQYQLDMKKEQQWFSYDFKPSFQQWTKANTHFGKDLYHQDSETFILTLPSTTEESKSQPDNPDSKEPQSQHFSETTKNHSSDIPNYQKNICSYISKKIVQNLIHPKSEKMVRKFCTKTNCVYQDAISYFSERSKEISGVNHLTMMLSPQNQEQINMKKMFAVFLNWFLRNKYMCYMLKFGKMEEKQKYIQSKNKYLLYIVQVGPRFEKYL